MIWLNALAAGAAVAVSLWAALSAPAAVEPTSAAPPAQRASQEVIRRNGEHGLLDASGTFIPIRAYERIVSGSTVGDDLLLALCEPTRILRFSKYGVEQSPFRYRFAGKGTGDPLADVEALIALRPDLVLVHDFGTAELVARLREAGVTVFDFGPMRGKASLASNLRSLGALLGRPERAAQIAARFERRLAGIAAGTPRSRWPRGLYLAVYGDQIFGGADGTSYHDVLTAAGVTDAAAERYDDWPDYGAEQILTLDPDVVVTHHGMRRLLCERPGLQELRACTSGAIVELDPILLSSPGLDMLEAAESLFEVVHLKESTGGTN